MSKFNKVFDNPGATTATTDIFGADITIQRDGILHIAVSSQSAASLSITLDGTAFEILNATLTANTVAFFDIPVAQEMTLNFQTAANETLDIFHGILETTS